MACNYDQASDTLNIQLIRGMSVDRTKVITPQTKWNIVAEYSGDNMVGLKCMGAKSYFSSTELYDMLEATTFTELRFARHVDGNKFVKIVSADPNVYLLVNPTSRMIDAVRFMDARGGAGGGVGHIY